MSRHYIDATNPDVHEVVVGYDRPLDHFFGDVQDKQTGDSLDPGLQFKGVRTIAELEALVEGYAVVPYSVTRMLVAESMGLAPTNRIIDHRAGERASEGIAQLFSTDVIDEAQRSWRIDHFSAARENDQEPVTLTIMRRFGEIPVAVIGTRSDPSKFAAMVLEDLLPERMAEHEPFIYISHDPFEGRLEQIRFADFRLRFEDHQLTVGPVVERRTIGQAASEEEVVEQAKTAAPRQSRSR